MLNSRARSRRALPLLLATSVGLLTGCGVAGTQFHPGIAAQVGETQITERHIDELSDRYCRAIEAVSAEQGGAQRIPMRYLTHEFVTTLVLEAATRQVADQYGVEPGPTYRSSLSQLEPQLEALSESQAEAVREIEGAQAYFQDVVPAIGGEVLAEAGSEEATDEDAAQAGQQAVDEWIADNDVEVNPKYAYAYGSAGQVDTDTSFATSPAAKDGLEAQPSEGYAAALPDSLVCGG